MFEGKPYDPTTNKTINLLKKNEEELLKGLAKLNENEKFLKSKSYINLFNNNPFNIQNDKKAVEQRIKSIEKMKNTYMMKLDEVKNRISSIEYNQEKELGIVNNNNKLKLYKFFRDLNDKENNIKIEQKIKKLQEDSEKVQMKMKMDLEKKIEKRNMELNNKEKEEEQKKMFYLKKMHDEEREEIQRRKNKHIEELMKIKDYIRRKPNDAIYLYEKQKFNYINHENNLVKLENNKRKALMKHINLNEFQEMKKNYEEIKLKREIESNEKIRIVKETWAKRFKLIPLYVNPLTKKVIEEENKIKEDEKNKELNKRNLLNRQKSYSKKVPKPVLLKRESKDDKNDKKKRIHLSKPNNYSESIRQKVLEDFKTKKENKRNKELSNLELGKNNTSLKGRESPKKRDSNKSYDNDKNKVKDKVVNYLKERRNLNQLKKEKKRNEGELSYLDYTGTNDIKKLIKDNGLDDKTLEVARCRLESIEEKKKQKNMLLKYSGGMINKPELGEEVCDLMIDSIHAKLSLIKELDKNLNESSTEQKNEIPANNNTSAEGGNQTVDVNNIE
jgi:hypothetical protein